MSQTSKGRAEGGAIVCPYCQNADRSLIEEQGAPVGPLRKFVCGVCSKLFIVRNDEVQA